MRRPLAIAAIVIAALAGAAASASAAAAPRPGFVPRSMWRPAVRPQPAMSPEKTAQLIFAPTTVTVNEVDYRMHMTVFAFFDRFFPPDVFVDVSLSRVGGGAAQVHDYVLEPASGTIAFHVARRTLATATLNTGTTVSPSVMQGAFTASAPPKRTACTLTNGRPGHRASARGTVAWSQFALDTGTSPFFGALADGPAAARLLYDPGCRQRRVRERRRIDPCGIRTALVASDRIGGADYAIATNFRRTATMQFAGASNGDSGPVGVFHFDVASGPYGDLPRPKHSSSGATEHFWTAAAPFLTGSATFTSNRPPVGGTRVRRCRAKGSVHRYTTLRYRGRLAPDALPLTAPFDTGAVVLSRALPASLVIRHYIG